MPITPRQANIYRAWADFYGILPLPLTEKHKLYRYKASKKLAEKLGVQQEHVRRAVYKVYRCLELGELLPPEEEHCPRCHSHNLHQLPDTKAGNRQFYCQDCHHKFVWFK
jgi:hypothetical protein